MLGFRTRNKEMPEIKLKNYTVYLKRLLLFAKAMNIKVQFDDVDSDGIWIPAVNKIKIDLDQSQSSTIAALLHELGHSIDDIFTRKFSRENSLFRAYAAMYRSRPTPSQRKMVLDCERKAWENGRDIAQRLKIRLGKWYDQAESTCLNSYRRN